MKYIALTIIALLLTVTCVAALNDTDVQQITDALTPIIQNSSNTTIFDFVNQTGEVFNQTQTLLNTTNDVLQRLNASITAQTQVCPNLSLSSDQLTQIYNQEVQAIQNNPNTVCTVNPDNLKANVNEIFNQQFDSEHQWLTSNLVNPASSVQTLTQNLSSCLTDNAILKNSFYAANLTVNSTVAVYQAQIVAEQEKSGRWEMLCVLLGAVLFLESLPFLYHLAHREKY